MDFGDIVILLILFAPLLRRLFGKKQNPAQRPASGDVEVMPIGPAPGDDPLAEALRQIRAALAEPEPTPHAAPKTVAASAPARSEFHALGAFEHDEHGFGRSNPISEEIFEQREPASSFARAQRIKEQALNKVDLKKPIEVTRDVSATTADMARMLTDHTRLREAFVMKEILDPPRSVHRGR